MAGESKTTRDHDTIRRWAEERDGSPAEVAGTAKGDDVGILRIDFPGYGDDDALQRISWSDFFQKFDERSLTFLYQEETSGGDQSRFLKFIRE